MATSSSVAIQQQVAEGGSQELTHWTRLEHTFVSERVRTILRMAPPLVRGQMRDLLQRAPEGLVAQEVASVLYLTVTTPESGALDSLMQMWEALDLPVRRKTREVFEQKFGGSIRSVLGHRLPAHLKSVLSW